MMCLHATATGSVTCSNVTADDCRWYPETCEVANTVAPISCTDSICLSQTVQSCLQVGGDVCVLATKNGVETCVVGPNAKYCAYSENQCHYASEYCTFSQQHSRCLLRDFEVICAALTGIDCLENDKCEIQTDGMCVPLSCEMVGTQANCARHHRCQWDAASGTCQSRPTCSGQGLKVCHYGNEIDWGCGWKGDVCAHCNENTDESSCTMFGGCGWQNGKCIAFGERCAAVSGDACSTDELCTVPEEDGSGSGGSDESPSCVMWEHNVIDCEKLSLGDMCTNVMYCEPNANNTKCVWKSHVRTCPLLDSFACVAWPGCTPQHSSATPFPTCAVLRNHMTSVCRIQSARTLWTLGSAKGSWASHATSTTAARRPATNRRGASITTNTTSVPQCPAARASATARSVRRRRCAALATNASGSTPRSREWGTACLTSRCADRFSSVAMRAVGSPAGRSSHRTRGRSWSCRRGSTTAGRACSSERRRCTSSGTPARRSCYASYSRARHATHANGATS